MCFFFFFQAEDGIRDYKVTGVQTCALPICCWARIKRRPPGVGLRTRELVSGPLIGLDGLSRRYERLVTHSLPCKPAETACASCHRDSATEGRRSLCRSTEPDRVLERVYASAKGQRLRQDRCGDGPLLPLSRIVPDRASGNAGFVCKMA